jgi:hypothetical protein
VALEWLGGSQPELETASKMVALRDSIIAMTQFAQRAPSVYLASRGVELPAWRCTTHPGRSARGSKRSLVVGE